jgi:hypothetical protein
VSNEGLVALLLQQLCHEIRERRIVIDHEDAGAGLRTHEILVRSLMVRALPGRVNDATPL